MTYYSAFRTSRKLYTARPASCNEAARIAWDVLTENGARPIVSMGLLDGLWMCELPDGSMDEVEAIWVTAQTPRVMRALSAAADRRARQGRG